MFEVMERWIRSRLGVTIVGIYLSYWIASYSAAGLADSWRTQTTVADVPIEHRLAEVLAGSTWTIDDAFENPDRLLPLGKDAQVLRLELMHARGFRRLGWLHWVLAIGIGLALATPFCILYARASDTSPFPPEPPPR
jgi:hypothetical protein